MQFLKLRLRIYLCSGTSEEKGHLRLCSPYKKFSWDAILLRLYCQCDRCVDKICLSSLNEDTFVQSVKLDTAPTDNDLLVEIGNDIFDKHVTKISLTWLRLNCYCDLCLNNAIAERQTSFVDPQISFIPSVEYSRIVDDRDAGLFEVAERVMKVGFCVIKDTPTVEETVIKVAEMFAPVHETVTNKMFNVRIQPGPRNTAHTALGLCYHQDLPWYETEPGVQFLHALKFDEDIEGGESQFVDLFQVAEILRKEDPEAFNDLARIPATYETIDYIRAKPAHYETLKPHIELDYFGNVVALHWNPGVEGTLRAKGDDVKKYYRGYNKLLGIIRRKELEWAFRMDAGDIIVFNNHRMVHARKAYSSKENGQRHLQGCYISLDEFRSVYVTLGESLNREVPLFKVGNKSSF
uniref:gamma-butyrobetaine dioxygenase-like isoform X1 n=2 Tax=Styela clava TaxID=7725 RepID=UPI00193A886D|nr:gamma-butyrobetaine dioxygenase-like isoform X1 [Styela clava]